MRRSCVCHNCVVLLLQAGSVKTAGAGDDFRGVRYLQGDRCTASFAVCIIACVLALGCQCLPVLAASCGAESVLGLVSAGTAASLDHFNAGWQSQSLQQSIKYLRFCWRTGLLCCLPLSVLWSSTVSVKAGAVHQCIAPATCFP